MSHAPHTARLVYVSDATRLMDANELNLLAARSRAGNARLGVTGMLLYAGGHFLQLLEGELGVVADLFDKIRADGRHTRVQRVLFEVAGDGRLCPDRPVDFVNLDAAPHADRPRFVKVIGRARRGADEGLLAELRSLVLDLSEGRREAA